MEYSINDSRVTPRMVGKTTVYINGIAYNKYE